MRILVTGAASALGTALVARLASGHSLRLLDPGPVQAPPRSEAIAGDVLDGDRVWHAVRGMDALVHTSAPPDAVASEGDGRVLEWFTRGTHVLLQACADAGVRRCVYAASLEVFRAYPDDVYISENWRPLPGPDVDEMGRHLGEMVCREFARDNPMSVTSLRLGKLVLEEETAGQEPDLMWLDVRDAARACECALAMDRSAELNWTRRWSVIHVCAEIPNGKYLTRLAQQMGFHPEHNFAAHWGPGGE